MWVFFHGSSKIQRLEEIASPPVIPMSYVLLDVDGRVLSYDVVSSDLSFEPRQIFAKITAVHQSVEGIFKANKKNLLMRVRK